MENPKNNDLNFQNYLVVYYDLLGQKEALRKIPSLPVSETEEGQFVESVKKSVGKVLTIRRTFKSQFDATLAYEPNTDLVPPEHRKEFIESQKTNLHYYGLSDAFVIAVPLMMENEYCTSMNGIFSALTATCGTMLLLLPQKILCRAGIDVGVGVQIDDREVYGPALERAFRIEAELAEYPRLVVGQELWAYLSWVENQKHQTRFGLFAAKTAKQCKNLMVQDTDGRIILDYLGENVKEAFGDEMDKDVVAKAWNFVNKQHIFQIKNGNEKLASRYFRMIRYFKSRLKIWGIE